MPKNYQSSSCGLPHGGIEMKTCVMFSSMEKKKKQSRFYPKNVIAEVQMKTYLSKTDYKRMKSFYFLIQRFAQLVVLKYS